MNLVKTNVADLRDMLRDLLTQSISTIVFTKQDGTERVMNATLIADELPEMDSKAKAAMESNEDIIKVFDIDAQGFRSIRLDSIEKVNEFEIGFAE